MSVEVPTDLNHIGIIMDGNRRWALERGLTTAEGHHQGMETARKISRYVLSELGIPWLSTYAFSTENWLRAEPEVEYLMYLLREAMTTHFDEFHDAGIRILHMGREEGLSEETLKVLHDAQARTKDNKNGTLAICFNYGGHQELVDATRSLVASGIEPDDIDETTFAAHLYHPDMPDINVMVRTSGEQRTSNFQPWRAVGAEYVTVEKFWPDIVSDDIDDILRTYARPR